jgi:mannose-1-phosphate guanylyltransferase
VIDMSEKEKNLSILPVIMAGGSGTRLWPLSRELYPKQFLKLGDDVTMLQSTLLRLQGLPVQQCLVIGNEQHRFLIAEQLRQLDALGRNILLEPAGRNTAPAIALAALHAMSQGQDPLLLVLAADHVIRDTEALHEAVMLAAELASQGHLVTFGVVPDRPETGYGYVQQGQSLGQGAYKVAAFVEKPSAELATSYLAGGQHLWNSGMFMFRASRYVEELRKFRPDILQACQAALKSTDNDMNFIRVNRDAFAACPSDSIDYAVMEKTDAAVVVPLAAGWSDVGAFAALWDVLPKDAQGNAFSGDVLALDSTNSLVMAESALVATIGVRDLVVVQTKDAVLVADRDKAQDVKRIVAQLRESGRTEHHVHRQVYRPWGQYDSIDSGARYQVKRITVQPGAKLSVQLHHHRAEHWVVVSGTARVTLDSQEHLLTENQSIYLPVGAVHALENPGKIPLDLIEVQVGSYLGEDDIVRLDDRYGRAG